MIAEHDRVALTMPLPAEKLNAGDIGTVVHVYDRNKAFEVEFPCLDGRSISVVTVEKKQVRSEEIASHDA